MSNRYHSSDAILKVWGWGASATLHVGVLASLAMRAGPAVIEPPKTPGHHEIISIEVAFSEPQLEELEQLPDIKTDVLVGPHRVQIGEQTFVPLVPAPQRLELPEIESPRQPTPESTVARDVASSDPVRSAVEPQPVAERPIAAGSDKATAPIEPSPASSSTSRQSAGTDELMLPIPLQNTPPVYPAQAYVSGQEGTVVLQLSIDPDGRVQEVLVHRSSGHSILDAAAFRAVKRWLFQPATRTGQEVAIKVLLPVRFALD